MISSEIESNQFAFLEKAALELGAIDAKVIPASEVFVENRVPLKCRTGCVGYGKKTYLPTICAYRGRVSEDYIRIQVRFAGEIQIYR